MFSASKNRGNGICLLRRIHLNLKGGALFSPFESPFPISIAIALLTHWSYVFRAFTHPYAVHRRHAVILDLWTNKKINSYLGLSIWNKQYYALDNADHSHKPSVRKATQNYVRQISQRSDAGGALIGYHCFYQVRYCCLDYPLIYSIYMMHKLMKV